MGQSLDPCFNFLFRVSGLESAGHEALFLLPASKTCPSLVEGHFLNSMSPPMSLLLPIGFEKCIQQRCSLQPNLSLSL